MFPLATPFPTPHEVAFFALVLGRMAGIFSSIPLFGGRRVPMNIKVVVVFAMTLVCYPIVKAKAPQIPDDALAFAMLMIQETLVGICLGILSLVVFAAVEFCGQIVGVQMGFSIVTEFDPAQGSQMSIMSVFQEMLATLLFVTLGVHHLFISALVDSYNVLPVGTWHMSEELLQFLTVTMGEVFVLAVKLAAPVMVSLLATTVVIGIMARSFPQMNVFIVTMPLNIGIGFLILGFSIAVFFHTLQGAFGNLQLQLQTLFRLMGPGG
ncbi:flagellar biosynthetic protein FliR [Geotalea uraniireducens]|uniref:Flagellar biosynthetic protein FliR n=1 Tax=Geotalea uraniireducens TaxID=351604 RepID=A0ABM8EGD6_9BACT|nr:flagellar biosynthetic protein FliR [Geotalea uraniireducens]BDV41464.1 flagellar biosynthetic protein FliR [Geotalea uraniireducens]